MAAVPLEHSSTSHQGITVSVNSVSVSSPPDPPTTANSSATDDLIYVHRDQEVIDQRIKPDDTADVHKYLAKYSVKWHTIGLYLRIPSEKLAEIEYNHRGDVSRMVAEMINEWMNNSMNCTWRALVGAVQDCDQTNTYNTASIQGPQIIGRSKDQICEESHQLASRNFWEEKGKSLTELQATFEVLLLLSHRSRSNCIKCLRDYFSIPDGVKDEMMYKNIKMVVPVELIYINKEKEMNKITQPLIDIISHFASKQNCLEVWCDLLITNMKEVSDNMHSINGRSVTKLAVLGDSITHRKEKGQMDTQNTIPHLKHLNSNLNDCLESINRTKRQTEHILTLFQYYRAILSGAISFSIIIQLVIQTILLVALVWLIPYITLHFIASTFFVACISIAIGKLLYDIHPSFPPNMLQGITRLYTFAFYHMVKTYVLTGAIITLGSYKIISVLKNLLWVFVKTDDFLQEAQPPALQHSYISLVRTFLSLFLLVLKLVSSHLIIDVSLGILIIPVVLALFGYATKRCGLIAFCCFLITLYFSAYYVTNTSWILVGAIVGASASAVMYLKFLQKQVVALLMIGFVLILSAIGMNTMHYIGKHVYEHKVMDVTEIVLAGATVGVCLLSLVKSTKIPLKYFNDPTTEPLQQLQENLYRLQSMRETIQILLHQDWLQELLQQEIYSLV